MSICLDCAAARVLGRQFQIFFEFFWGDFFTGDLVTWDTVGTLEQTAFVTRDTQVANRLAGMLTDPQLNKFTLKPLCGKAFITSGGGMQLSDLSPRPLYYACNAIDKTTCECSP